MDEPTAVEPTIAERAQRVHRAIFERVANTPAVSGAGVSEAILIEEAQRELLDLDAERILEIAAVTVAHEGEMLEQRQALEAERAAALEALRQSHIQAVDQLAARHQTELEAERDTCAAKVAKLGAKGKAQDDTHAIEIAAFHAALVEARARSIYEGPEVGDSDTWRKRLAAMPTPASQEIASWMQSAVRRLAVIGANQTDAIIARLALVLLKPYTEAAKADAETT